MEIFVLTSHLKVKDYFFEKGTLFTKCTVSNTLNEWTSIEKHTRTIQLATKDSDDFFMAVKGKFDVVDNVIYV